MHGGLASAYSDQRSWHSCLGNNLITTYPPSEAFSESSGKTENPSLSYHGLELDYWW